MSNQETKLAWYSGQNASCICGYLVHVATLCLYSFNIKKCPQKILPPHPLYPTILFGWWFLVQQKINCAQQFGTYSSSSHGNTTLRVI
jgi:hypothetical protein